MGWVGGTPTYRWSSAPVYTHTPASAAGRVKSQRRVRVSQPTTRRSTVRSASVPCAQAPRRDPTTIHVYPSTRRYTVPRALPSATAAPSRTSRWRRGRTALASSPVSACASADVIAARREQRNHPRVGRVVRRRTRHAQVQRLLHRPRPRVLHREPEAAARVRRRLRDLRHPRPRSRGARHGAGRPAEPVRPPLAARRPWTGISRGSTPDPRSQPAQDRADRTGTQPRLSGRRSACAFARPTHSTVAHHRLPSVPPTVHAPPGCP
jgi:hypothetical protein